ncbi:hypothetical protein [Erwinia sp. CGal63]|uniref:hypothetical protein n=1 Tax=Erwinia sp. CGal63 TaxID=2919889 RepID=UPI00300A4781
MNKINVKKLIYIITVFITVYFSWLITHRYFPVEPDAANSPLVWRALMNEGAAVFKDWAPTPDNWYFTVYPINFIFFMLSGSDGIASLTASTSFFVAFTAIILAAIVCFTTKSWHAVFILFSLIFLPAYLYTYGFVAHPFSHYSTNFFGVVCLALAVYNIKKNSTILAGVYSIIAVFSAVSDPWFSATYFLPLLLTHGYFTWKKVISLKSTTYVFVAFVLSMTHVIPRMLGLPIQRFKLVPLEQWLANAEWTCHILGRSLNLFFVDNPIAWIASLIIWVGLTIWALYICLRQQEKRIVFISLFSFLTISAIISSFIVSYDSPAEISARFFVNAICFVVVLVTLLLSFSKNIIPGIVLTLYIASSLYSYHVHTRPLYDQKQQTYDYINFLEKNNLTYGYADFWAFSNSVNWLTEGRVHITSVLFKDDYSIDFSSSRSQTMRSWLTEDFIRSTPERQFIAIPAVNSEGNAEANFRIQAIEKQFGKSDEQLPFQNMIILIYNHQLAIR